jgi:hypothetical protein
VLFVFFVVTSEIVIFQLCCGAVMRRAAVWLLACMLPLCFAAHALDRAECDRESGVRIGNEGKDVIWVPTHDRLVTAMLRAADTKPDDYVIDLGAGDGKIPIAAAKEFGARALGVEYDERMVQLARCYVEAEGLAERVEIRQADIFETDLSAATVLTLYLLPKLNKKLRPTILELAPGTRVVSNRFDMGRWQPDRTIAVEGVANEAYLWIVPARVAGTWTFEEESGENRFTVRFEQRFQKLRAKVRSNSRMRIRNARLDGAQIELELGTQQNSMHLRGMVAGDRIELAGGRDGVGLRYVGWKK